MNLIEAKSTLLEFKKLSVEESNLRVRELEEAFKVFWDSKPDENTFEKHLGSVLLTARMLYYIWFGSFE